MVDRPNAQLKEANQLSENHENLKRKLKELGSHYSKMTLLFVICYRFLVIASAFLSISAAVVIKLDFLPEKPPKEQITISRNDIAAILAASATIATTLLGAFNFESSVQANRYARDRVQQLELELLREKPNYDKIIDNLQKTMESRLLDLPSSKKLPEDT